MTTTSSMTADDVRAALARFHGCDTATGEWVCLPEALAGSGGGIDMLAVGVWQRASVPGLPGCGKCGGSKVRYDTRNPIVAYEIKVSRADARRELVGYEPSEAARFRARSVPPWPGKARRALDLSHYFLFATPAGLFKESELGLRRPLADHRGLWLPEEAGLLEVAENGTCRVRIPPARRAPNPLTRSDTALLLRQAAGAAARERRLREEIISLQAQLDQATAQPATTGEA